MIQTDFEGPIIVRLYPVLGGRDNAGVGETEFGERYVLKLDSTACLAEFVGAAVCRAVGVPTCEPCVVTLNGKPVFGSRLEAGLLAVPDFMGLQQLLDNCDNVNAFSAVFAVDLALGNPDRHWANWLYQTRDGTNSVLMRSVDFSRSWPVWHPPLQFDAIRGQNTHESWVLWPQLGINFDQVGALNVCDTMQKLNGTWLTDLLAPLPLEWKTGCNAPALCNWWKAEWPNRVKETKNFVEAGAWQ